MYERDAQWATKGYGVYVHGGGGITGTKVLDLLLLFNLKVTPPPLPPLLDRS